MPTGDAYRDELSAAQARIERLERELAQERASNQHAAMLVALKRERARAAGEPQGPTLLSKWMLLLVFVASWATGAGLIAEGDWFRAVAAFGVPLLVGGIGYKILKANAAANRQQVVLVDQRIAEIEKAMNQSTDTAG